MQPTQPPASHQRHQQPLPTGITHFSRDSFGRVSAETGKIPYILPDGRWFWVERDSFAVKDFVEYDYLPMLKDDAVLAEELLSKVILIAKGKGGQHWSNRAQWDTRRDFSLKTIDILAPHASELFAGRMLVTATFNMPPVTDVNAVPAQAKQLIKILSAFLEVHALGAGFCLEVARIRLKTTPANGEPKCLGRPAWLVHAHGVLLIPTNAERKVITAAWRALLAEQFPRFAENPRLKAAARVTPAYSSGLRKRLKPDYSGKGESWERDIREYLGSYTGKPIRDLSGSRYLNTADRMDLALAWECNKDAPRTLCHRTGCFRSRHIGTRRSPVPSSSSITSKPLKSIPPKVPPSPSPSSSTPGRSASLMADLRNYRSSSRSSVRATAKSSPSIIPKKSSSSSMPSSSRPVLRVRGVDHVEALRRFRSPPPRRGDRSQRSSGKAAAPVVSRASALMAELRGHRSRSG